MKLTESQKKIIAENSRETVFYSRQSQCVYPLSRIHELEDDELNRLYSEVLLEAADLQAARDEMDLKIKAGEHFPFSMKLRRKHQYTMVFRKAIQRLVDERSAASKSKSNTAAQETTAHDSMLRKYEYTKRKYLIRMVIDRIGMDAFEVISGMAAELANQESPDPTRPENRHLWRSGDG